MERSSSTSPVNDYTSNINTSNKSRLLSNSPLTPPPSASKNSSQITFRSQDSVVSTLEPIDYLINKPKVDESVASSSDDSEDNQIYCICRRTTKEYDDPDDFMIECDKCEDWLHGKCIKIPQYTVNDIESYVCPRCIRDDTKTVYKKRANYHRNNIYDSEADELPIQNGTPIMVKNLLTRNFPDALTCGIVNRMRDGADLNLDFFNKHDFTAPILVEQADHLGLKVPPKIDYDEIERIVNDSKHSLDVIDVEKQEAFTMTLGHLVEYFKQVPRTKILNLLSFEITYTNLNKVIISPRIVDELSWVTNGVWPENMDIFENDKNINLTEIRKDITKRPAVQKYCLMSAANSYTDFHVDFGGSSVWYHVAKGEKYFYLIEPTQSNLNKYEQWNSSKNLNEIFLADIVDKCYIFKITEGNTILIPSGWIHAVFTPTDSIVFGGNFLHSFNISLQIK
jgi:hypothetical protein